MIQFAPETDIEVDRFEGRVELIRSCKATRFQSLEELLAFLSNALTEVRGSEELGYQTVIVSDAQRLFDLAKELKLDTSLTDSGERMPNVGPEQGYVFFPSTLHYRKVTEHLPQVYDSRPQPGLS